MRTQYCRMHIDSVAEECGIESRYVQEVKDAANFADKYCSMLQCSTRAIHALIKVSDPEIQARAISTIEKALFKASFGGKQDVKAFTEKQVKAFIERAKEEIEDERAKEQARIAKEAQLAAEESARLHREAAALPAVPMKTVEIIEVVETEYVDPDDEGSLNRPVEKFKKPEEGEDRVAPSNSLKTSYGKQTVGENRIPDLGNESPLGEDPEGLAVLIATANESIQAFIQKDKEVLIKRHGLKVEREALEDECKPLEEALKELKRKISEKTAAMKVCDNDRQRIGQNLDEQYGRIVELKAKQEKLS